MSKLEELIQRYCPDGVEWSTIGDVCQKVFAGGTPTSSNSSYYGGDIPWLRSGEVNFNEITSTEKTITEEGYNSSSARWVESRSVLVAMTGATVARSAITLIELTANQSVCALTPKRDILNYRYLFYWISKSYIQMKGMAQGALTSLNLNLIKSLEIPIPPLPVQEEIVRVLDTFTELQAELQAELQKRLQQYNYYRDNLLSFDGRTDVEWKKLGEIATEWYRGAGIKRDEVSEEGYPCIRYGEIHTTYNIWFDECVSHTDESQQPARKYADYGDILFAITSEDIPFVGNSVAYLGKERILVGGDIVVMKHTQDPKYMSYVLSTSDAVKQKGKGKVKSKVVHTNVPSLQEIVVPLPSLEEQKRIASTLDKFYSLLNDLTSGLPAEIEKRKQQYEYYRDKLLTFKRITK